MARRKCPYYKYGQCTVAPKSIATTIIEARRCSEGWKNCNYYIRSSTNEAKVSPPRNNGTLEEYVNNAYSRVESGTRHCIYLKGNYCKAKGKTLSTTEIIKCYTRWKDCSSRFREEKDFESKLSMLMRSLSEENL